MKKLLISLLLAFTLSACNCNSEPEQLQIYKVEMVYIDGFSEIRFYKLPKGSTFNVTSTQGSYSTRILNDETGMIEWVANDAGIIRVNVLEVKDIKVVEVTK